jgi:hypothetical protein
MSQVDIDRLANWRTVGARHSEEAIELAGRVLKSSGLGAQGEHEALIHTRQLYL